MTTVEKIRLYKRVREVSEEDGVTAKTIEELAELAVECLYNIRKMTIGISATEYARIIDEKILDPWDQKIKSLKENPELHTDMDDYKCLVGEMADVITTVEQKYKNFTMANDIDAYQRYTILPALQNRYLEGTLLDDLDMRVVHK